MLHLTHLSDLSPSSVEDVHIVVLLEDDLHDVEHVLRVSAGLQVYFCHQTVVSFV